MSGANLEDYDWLQSDEARECLKRVAQSDSSLPSLVAKLRCELSPTRTHLLMQLADLRVRAVSKFSRASEMFFTPTRLEQATSESIASWKATWFPEGRLADLCCGIGGDMVGLAQVAPVEGCDWDEVSLRCAIKNCDVYGAVDARFRRMDAREFPVEAFAAWHLDPDRRPDGPRRTRLELFQPDVAEIDRLKNRNPHAAIKLAPATVVPEAWEQSGELRFVGHQRECKQLVACFGKLVQAAGMRVAQIVGDEGQLLGEFRGQSDERTKLGEVDRFVFEPHAAVRAAKLSAALANSRGWRQLASGIDYFTAAESECSAMMQCYRVIATESYDRKRVKRLLREHEVGLLEFKTRGTRLKPEAELKFLSVAGPHSRTLLVYPRQGSFFCVLAERLTE